MSQDTKQAKTTTIVINATSYEVEGKDITYEQVVNLFYNNAPPTGENVVITVTYSRGENGQEGSLLPGDAVKLKSKMVFDVSATDRS
jgi:Multiubiquitin